MATSGMTDRDYETLVQNIHRSIMRNEGMSSVEIEHDKRIVGRSGQKHQIDVYWKYVLAGVTFQTAIECRKYKNDISVGKVRDFLGVLTDIGNIQGVMITTSAYQSGAATFADHYGIKLAVIRDVTDGDLEGFIKTIILNVRVITKSVTAWNINVSLQWTRDSSIDEKAVISFAGQNSEIGIFDSQGAFKRSFLDIENSLPVYSEDGNCLPEGGGYLHEVDVRGGFLQHHIHGLIPIESFSVTYKIHHTEIVSHVVDPHPTTLIYENFGETGDTLHIHENNGSVIIK